MSSIRVRIRAVLPSLTPVEQRVARVVLDDHAASGWTIGQLAVAADTSASAVVRFCKALGLRGYPELRLSLANEDGRAEAFQRAEFGGDISPSDDLAQVVAKLGFADATAVEQTAEQLDVEGLSRVVSAVEAAGTVLAFGVAASGFVAADLHLKFERIGRSVYLATDPHLALMKTALLGPGDVAVGISHTGETVEVIDMLAEARSRGAFTVALTNFPRSAVCRHADEVLTTAARETTFRSGAMASRIAQLMVVDCLFVGVAQRRHTQAVEALETTRAVIVRQQGRLRKGER